jgi:diadenosine tetraphosphate (Ap4A) HIT family hydrolase
MSSLINGGCPFCIENGKVNILFQNDTAYLIAVLDGGGNVMTGCYFIIPKMHITTVRKLPSGWQESVNQLLGNIPGVDEGHPFNLSYNVENAAGQRVAHVHMWVIMRSHDSTLPSYGLGLAALISKIDQTTKVEE